MVSDIDPPEWDTQFAGWPEEPQATGEVEIAIVRGGAAQEGAVEAPELIVASEGRHRASEQGPTEPAPGEGTVVSIGAAATGRQGVEADLPVAAPSEGEVHEAPAPHADTGAGNEGDIPATADDRELQSLAWSMSRQGIRAVASILERHGIDPGEALSRRPGLRDLLPDLRSELTPREIAEQRVADGRVSLTEGYIASAASPMLRTLTRYAREQGIEDLPQPVDSASERDPAASTAAWVSALRKAKGVPIARLAEAAEVNPSTYSKFASGQSHSVWGAVKAYLRAMDTDPDTIEAVREAFRAERKGDQDRAREILATLELPQPSGDTHREPRDQDPRAFRRNQLRAIVANLPPEIDVASLLPKHWVVRDALPWLTDATATNAELGDQLGVGKNQISIWRAEAVDALVEDLPVAYLPEELHPQSPRIILEQMVQQVPEHYDLSEILTGGEINALPVLMDKDLTTAQAAERLHIAPQKVLDMRQGIIIAIQLMRRRGEFTENE